MSPASIVCVSKFAIEKPKKHFSFSIGIWYSCFLFFLIFLPGKTEAQVLFFCCTQFWNLFSET